MPTIIWEEGDNGVMKLLKDIPSGTTFTGQIASYPSRLFLRMGRELAIGVVSLDYPEHFWSDYGALEIRNYKEVSISIRVRG